MFRVLLYMPRLPRRPLATLQAAAGAPIQNSELPVVVDFDSAALAEPLVAAAKQLELEACVVTCGSPEDVGVAADAATELVRNSELFREMCADLRADASSFKTTTHETQHCWVVLAWHELGGIPPGEAYLVDKCSGKIFPRRLVDVARLVDPTFYDDELPLEP